MLRLGKNIKFLNFIISLACLLMGMSMPCNAVLRCSFDGSTIQTKYEVIIVQEKFKGHFSSVSNANFFLAKNSNSDCCILVTDEITGKKINAKDAFYVKSKKITTPHTGNRIHVFASKQNARAHADNFNGKFVKFPFKIFSKKNKKEIIKPANTRSTKKFFFESFQKSIYFESRPFLINITKFVYIPFNYPSEFSSNFNKQIYKPPKNSV